MKQAGCNMTNNESYIRAALALLIGLAAIKFEWWFLLLFSAILFYTASKKFCLMFSLLGINKKLSVENYFYALLPQYSPYASCIFDESGETIYLNNAAKKQFDAIRNSADFGINNAKKYIDENTVSTMLYEHKGETYQLHIQGIKDEKVLLLHINNITNVLDLQQLNSKLEDKVENALSENELKDRLLVQQSKLAVTGELIENIIHQWRQPLSTLASLLGSLQLRHTINPLSSDEMDEEIERAIKLIKIMNTTASDFKNFFKTDKKKSLFSIKSCMNDVMLILGDSLKHSDIDIIENIEPEIMISGFKNEFTQVLLNIINNARDAFHETKSTPRQIKIYTSLKDSKVILSIADTAGGIPEKYLSKIFDSHFTTKEHTEGTGIGLHMSKAILENDMKGTITVQNINGGANFMLTFPYNQ